MADDNIYKRVNSVYEHGLKERKRWEPLWKECAEFVQPEYLDIDGQGTHAWNPRDLIGNNVYDGSPRVSAQVASSGLFGYSTNPADEWVSIDVEARELRKLPTVKDWITDVNHLLMQTFEKYDLYEQLVPAYNSMMAIGTATLSTEEDRMTDGIQYRFWHPGDYVLGSDGYNRVNQFGNEWEYENHQLLTIYTPEELGAEIMQQIEEDPLGTTSVRYMIMPNELYEKGNPFANKFKWAGYHLHPTEEKILKVDGYQEFPLAVWRWTVQGRLSYGLSPAAKALPDIYILNQSARTRLEAEQKMADPPMNIPKELMDDYHLGPGGRNFYRSPDRQVFPIGARYDYPAAIDAVNRYTEIVNKHFFTDFFIMLSQSSTRRTTGEVAELMQEKAAMLGPIVSFMNRSFLDPIVHQTLKILGKQGKLPPPPVEVLDQEVKLNYLGPLSVAQKYAQVQKRIIAPINTAVQYAELDPTILDNIDFDKTTRILGETFNIPYGILREEGDVVGLRKARAEAAQRQAQAEAEAKQAETTMKYGAKAIEQGSLLDEARNAG